ncbi:MAG: CRTAC1 family protein [Planctomycetota bacterium]
MPPTSTTGLGGTGVCVEDFDGDGDMDVVVPQGPGQPILYFRNEGAMQFVDATATAGLGNGLQVRCLNAADIDNDGDRDLYVGNDDSPAQLFVNNGAGSFTDEALARGISHDDANYAAAFGDYNRDGWLDLYIGQRTNAQTGQNEPNILLRNDGGVFTDVTLISGVYQTQPTLCASFMDYNEDGWPDLIVANDKGLSYGPNQLLRNNGDGTFVDVSVATGTNIAIDGMSIDYLDVFNDGGVDFYCTDLPTEHLFQQWDPQAGSYINATAQYGLQGGGIGWSSNWLDYDNDGWQDLHVVQWGTPNLMFKNPAQPASANAPWSDQAAALGINFPWIQHCAAIADFDDDGRIDLLERFHAGPPQAQAPDGIGIYQNQVTGGGNWIKFRTRGTVSNRDGIGARFVVQSGSLVQRQQRRNGTGFLTGSDPRLHFGLGAASSVDRVDIYWPSGQIQHLTNIAANQIVDVVEPSMLLSSPVGPGASTFINVTIPGDAGLPYYIALSLTTAPGTLLPDGNRLPLNIDGLTSLTIVPNNPILPASAGLLDANGTVSAQLNIPPLSLLSGLTLYATAMTTDAANFPLLRTLFPRALPITLQ